MSTADLLEHQLSIELPAPRVDEGRTLLAALKARRSAREFAATPLPAEMLSNLLWAAYGINRPETGGRTAPSAHDWQEIEVYAALPGLAAENCLRALRGEPPVHTRNPEVLPRWRERMQRLGVTPLATELQT